MRYSEISPAMRVFLGNWQALRNLGFSADNITCVTSRAVELDGALALYCCLKVDDKEFNIFCGPVSWTEKQMRKEYKRCAAALTSGRISDEDVERIFYESQAHKNPDGFLAALYEKGMLVPDDEPSEPKGPLS